MKFRPNVAVISVCLCLVAVVAIKHGALEVATAAITALAAISSKLIESEEVA